MNASARRALSVAALIIVSGLRLAARLLPFPLTRAIGRAAGLVVCGVLHKRRRLARDQVCAALGVNRAEGARVVRRMFLHFGESVAELLGLADAEVEETRRVEGLDHLHRALDLGRGALFVTAHLGNFELAVRGASWVGRPVSVLSKRFTSPLSQMIWRRLRLGGPTILDSAVSGRETLAALRRNEVVVFVLDQHDPGRRAVILPFFGRPAATSAALSRAARLSGAPVLPVFTARKGGRHVVTVGAPLGVSATGSPRELAQILTAEATNAIEAAIREAPEQWLWLHRSWKVSGSSGAGTGASEPRGGPPDSTGTRPQSG